MNLGTADTGVQKRHKYSFSQEQADTGARDRKMMLQPQVLCPTFQPIPEGSYVQALDPSACPYPSNKARPEPECNK